jgi:hypothetical protein
MRLVTRSKSTLTSNRLKTPQPFKFPLQSPHPRRHNPHQLDFPNPIPILVRFPLHDFKSRRNFIPLTDRGVPFQTVPPQRVLDFGLFADVDVAGGEQEHEDPGPHEEFCATEIGEAEEGVLEAHVDKVGVRAEETKEDRHGESGGKSVLI